MGEGGRGREGGRETVWAVWDGPTIFCGSDLSGTKAIPRFIMMLVTQVMERPNMTQYGFSPTWMFAM